MTSTPPPSHGRAPLRTVQVLGHGATGSAAHVRSLAAGLVARGVQVTVCAPREADETYGFTAAGARFAQVAPRTDPVSLASLRSACWGADVVHAHGLRAGLRAVLAVRGLRGPRGGRVPLVVTWHTRAHPEGARARLVHLMERRVARAAAVVLGACSDLVDRARERGARDARLAPVTLTRPREAAVPPADPDRTRHKERAELGAVDRPLIVSVGRLEPHQGHDLLLDAAHAWCALDPQPLLVIAGEGAQRPALQRRIDTEQLPVLLAGRRGNVPELVAAADVVVLAGHWEARPLLAQEALRAGVPLVAIDSGGTRELVGRAAELVRHGDAAALARTVTGLLADPVRRATLAAAGPVQAAGWPTEDDTVAQVLSVYDELTQPGGGHSG
ncbi:glycosyltransferase family 4 protein [Streptomyces pinistramenti]|uniref:glycosyltransferase family 4 protein n=1 Tax=Streptomyces pinistramenti TaxID=2884812 RepID=UPI001D093696|nr:glycosyltransferase family 4 protein [Streptomyces pinistramenti]MCB5909909.1 glycosyltransferase family 4 protein [Streptomyces pinistramenti]